MSSQQSLLFASLDNCSAAEFESTALGYNYQSLIKYSKKSSKCKKLLKSNEFWRKKGCADFNLTEMQFNKFNKANNAHERYIQLLTERGGCVSGSEQFLDLDTCLKRAKQENNSDLIKLFSFLKEQDGFPL